MSLQEPGTGTLIGGGRDAGLSSEAASEATQRAALPGPQCITASARGESGSMASPGDEGLTKL